VITATRTYPYAADHRGAARHAGNPAEPRYGLDIAQEAGLETGTVHPIRARIENAGWIEKFWEDDAQAEAKGRPRRRYYQFTPGGAETSRLAIAAATQTSAATGALRPQPGRLGGQPA
jgi:PadR family transcriptional regulator, regulatory protein PadR